MNIKYFYFCCLAFAFACSPKPIIQPADKEPSAPVPLMTIGNEEVFADEFLHILSKNRAFQEKEAIMDQAIFEENFELFVNFKLKVKEAENRGLDQTEEFEREFSIFKEDLIRPFLIKNSLQEGELMKAYNRMQEIVKASHILLQFPANASREDTIAVFRMAQKLKTQSEEGADFNELALEYSDDPSAQENKGSLGYFTALQMVHQFEDAAFGIEVGEISEPILTNYGYHIIKLEDRKPNPGEIRVSHILVRSQSGDPVAEERALRRVGDIYTELQKEESVWEEVCAQYSEDQGTKNSGGLLPFISIGSVIPDFEKVAFSLTEIGEISPPVKTPYGYHIIRLEDKKPFATFEEMEPMIKSKILRDSRSTLIQSQVTSIQKSRFNFEENEALVDSLISKFENQSRAMIEQELENPNLENQQLFSINGVPTELSDLREFIQSNTQTIRPGTRNYFATWYDKFVEVSLNQSEEKYLEENNKEYQLTLKEYRDGILLFTLMNENVWQKALEDSLGQVSFYEKNVDRYQWKERTEALIVKMAKDNVSAGVRRFLSDKSYQKNLVSRLENTFLNDDPLAFTIDNNIYEFDSHPILSRVMDKKSLQEIKIDNKTHFILLGNKIPAGPKKFDETRGKVIQDYQEYLDKSLLETLKANYIIRINEEEKNRVYEFVTNQ
ncbi:peptidylprolyl isomerase [Belliella pelovolcani]|uniref:Peptidyl-prolyl cis-trans isomerase SurA n=1 Tax=Belliella pelovolcani TaxID=529505 RepID=A0A1N7JTZ2_9BACT|nr:peptidylprolyl isomerase [Belliella pelovolcani]SIS52797.1 peptidyl-prolyl cis-trans isomerase SurA [Belliella pelovolcani]